MNFLMPVAPYLFKLKTKTFSLLTGIGIATAR